MQRFVRLAALETDGQAWQGSGDCFTTKSKVGRQQIPLFEFIFFFDATNWLISQWVWRHGVWSAQSVRQQDRKLAQLRAAPAEYSILRHQLLDNGKSDWLLAFHFVASGARHTRSNMARSLRYSAGRFRQNQSKNIQKNIQMFFPNLVLELGWNAFRFKRFALFFFLKAALVSLHWRSIRTLLSVSIWT